MKRSLIAFLLLAATACGSKSSEDKKRSIGDASDFRDLHTNYFLQDPSCLSDESDIYLDNFIARSWNKGLLSEEAVSGQDFKGSPSLSGSIVDRTFVSHVSIGTCSFDGVSYHCPNSKVEKTLPVDLKVCQGGASFPRNSYEGVGLTSLSHIESAFKYYSNHENALRTLPKVNLFILPKVERWILDGNDPSIVREKKTLSNNLTYIDSYYDKPSFMVHPTSRESDPGVNPTKPNLWESKWALSHEFGHHVLTSHTGMTTMSFAGNLLHPFNHANLVADYRHFQVNKQEASGDARLVTTSDVWGAVNEGFADLFGHFSTGDNAGKTHGLECFEQTRDITSNVFTNGAIKRLDGAAYRIFYSSQSYATESCKTPNLQSIHVMGGVIAHALYSVNRYSSSSAYAGTKVIAFADALGEFVRKSQKQFTLGDLVGVGVKVFAGLQGTLQPNERAQLPSAICQVASEKLSGLTAEWREKGYFHCF